jgi:glycine/D-amino acid oxidase-like deaminating enzyme|tara:strand:- start:1232 stop:2359 length:1128 start_codon:yes stop_codon:yes gene_type:complete
MSPANNKLSPYDWIIVGGGLVGASIAYGLIQKQPQLRILVLDGGDTDHRASVGNFGLIWVQGKGNDFPAYANWSLQGADLWPEFARQLSHKSQIDIAYQRQGGLEFALSQHQLSVLREEMATMSRHTQGRFQYTLLDRNAALALQPGLGEAVVGAAYSPQDGQVNPLYLLSALHKANRLLGVEYQSRCPVEHIEVLEHGFNAAGSLAKHIVLCAGLDNQRLGKQLAMHLPVTPVKGQILITERAEAGKLPYASPQMRQTAEGTIQIGGSHEHKGLDNRSSLDIMQAIANDAVTIMPELAKLHLVRSWSALRVMSPDGAPIYQRSTKYQGAFGVCCHSGVSLAAAHAGLLSSWLLNTLDRDQKILIEAMNNDRFAV